MLGTVRISPQGRYFLYCPGLIHTSPYKDPRIVRVSLSSLHQNLCSALILFPSNRNHPALVSSVPVLPLSPHSSRQKASLATPFCLQTVLRRLIWGWGQKARAVGPEALGPPWVLGTFPAPSHMGLLCCVYPSLCPMQHP